MKLRALLAGLVATGILAAGALAAPNANPAGSYKAIVTGQAAALNGRWVLKFTTIFGPAGKFQTFRNGRLVVSGTTVFTGDKVTLVDMSGSYACGPAEKTGVYTFKKPAANKLKFISVVDPCAGRKILLDNRTFTKQ
jgi:hypothetical protein